MKILSTILAIALLLVLYAWHTSVRSSNAKDWYIDELEQAIGPIEAERDSLQKVIDSRTDSIGAYQQVADSLMSMNARLRRDLRQRVIPKPDFTYAGTDSALIAQVDSILRARGGYE